RAPQAPARTAAPAPTAPQERGPALNLRSPARMVERELLKLALQRPDLVAPTFDAYGADEFTAPPYAVVRQCIQEAGGVSAADADYTARVMDAAPDNTIRSLITELSVERLLTRREPDPAYAGEQLVRVRVAAVDARIASLEGAARRCEFQGDHEGAAAVHKEVWVLQQYGQSLRERGAAAL
ncbi:DNA primase, partial [Streptomyces sp. SID8354]|nr:DNA primase [Streptomyces sp. SID8354]